MKGFFKFILLSAISSIVLFACDNTEKPAQLLSEEKMAAVLMDVYIAEQKVSRLGLGVDSTAEVFALMEKKIFEKHQVDDSVFKMSLNYYTGQSAALEKIYGVVIDSLQLQEQRSVSQGSLVK